MTLRERLGAGETILGFANTFPATGIVELMCKDVDLAWIDCQHGQIDYMAALDAVRAADRVGILSMVRVPTHDPLLLGTYADLSPSALMIPMVETVEQARSVARALTFPPLGNRSFGGRRPIDIHGLGFYRTHQPLIVAQIETLESVACAEAIAAVEGIDVLFFGPDDMKLRMGIPVETSPLDHPELLDAMRRTAKIARAAGKWSGTTAANGKAARAARDMGYQMLMCGADAQFLRLLPPQRLAEVRDALGE